VAEISDQHLSNLLRAALHQATKYQATKESSNVNELRTIQPVAANPGAVVWCDQVLRYKILLLGGLKGNQIAT
jgi:hypothetical protein